MTGFARSLLTWFDRHRRELPWRRDRDPYRIWVSEVMLQQTTVAAVGPYFERFIQAFPTVADLAAADEQDVLKLWEGLGYYRRARHLHHSARQLMSAGGELPNDPAVWSALPGVGRYILGAVLSQAFDRRLPIVEANTVRVLCRLFAQTGDPKSGIVQKWLWEQAATLLPRKRAGDFNQAMMELGALVCTVRQPACEQCPVRKHCLAYEHNLQATIPAKSARPAIVDVQEVATVIEREGRVLLAQRSATASRWASMWEFPHGELQPGELHEDAARRIGREALGIDIQPGEEMLTLRHGVTRFHITMPCLRCEWLTGEVVAGYYQRAMWLKAAELAEYPVSAPQRTLARAVAEPGGQGRLF